MKLHNFGRRKLMTDAGPYISGNYDMVALRRGEFNKRMKILRTRVGGRLHH